MSTRETKQKFSVLLTRLFQRSGIALSIEQIEELRKNSDELVLLIEEVSKIK